ncbi:MAG: hypothetical protein IPP72_09905 [Chitinophagaceae bacterium]|nr:hypothetical protein [Chitinophagaceae bacterium]
MIAKLVFYALAVISSLLVLYLLFITSDNLQKLPYTKKSEIIIFIIALLIMAAGTIIGIRQVNYYSKYATTNIIFIVSISIAFITILIGLLFFNGPIKWN